METKIFSTEKQSCCDDETEAENGCCDNEIHLVKIQDNQDISSNTIALYPEIKKIDLFYSLVIEANYIAQNAKVWVKSESPPFNNIPILFKHRQLII